VFIADSQFNNIRRLFFNGTIMTVHQCVIRGDSRLVCLPTPCFFLRLLPQIAGNGTAGLWNEAGLGVETGLRSPVSVSSDGSGGVLIGDTGNSCKSRAATVCPASMRELITPSCCLTSS
jgi:hypothetical protein